MTLRQAVDVAIGECEYAAMQAASLGGDEASTRISQARARLARFLERLPLGEELLSNWPHNADEKMLLVMYDRIASILGEER